MCRNCFIQPDGDKRLRVLKQIKQKVVLLLFLTDVSDAEAQASKGSKRKLPCCSSELPKSLRTTGISNFMMYLITPTFQLLKISLMSDKNDIFVVLFLKLIF